jgi:hypothetical protein
MTIDVVKPDVSAIAIREYLEHAGTAYLDKAPTVENWLNDLYIRIGEEPHKVSLFEINQAMFLYSDGEWEHPNYAANRVYKVMHMLGQDVTGHAGF